MKKPKMVLFDYGQTLGNASGFDGVKGTQAVLEHAIDNKYHLTASQVQEEADKINRELNRLDPEMRHSKLCQVEVPNHMFTLYLYQSLGIRLSLTAEQIDRIFWDHAAPAVPTDGLEEFLDFLYENNIRTAVLSNISFAGNVVEERIRKLLPSNHFEFILATSEYLFRKPNERIFRLALEKAGLEASEVWYVGDNYECDVEGSRNAGMFPVWYLGATENVPEKPDDVLRIFHWNELKSMIERGE